VEEIQLNFIGTS